jgi:hypothetical protein
MLPFLISLTLATSSVFFVKMISPNPHEGSSFASFLEENEIRCDVEAHAKKSVLAWLSREKSKAKRSVTLDHPNKSGDDGRE